MTMHGGYLGVCFIGSNSENSRLGRLRLCLIDSPFPKTAGLAGLLNLLLKKAEGLADF